MKNTINKPTKEQIKATSKIRTIRLSKTTDEELCALIGISKPTLYKRLKSHDWKLGEILAIKNVSQ